MATPGYEFLHILSAEGRHHPMPGVTAEEYEASRQHILEMLNERKPAMDPLKMHRLIIAAVVESYLNRQIEYQDLLEIQHFIDNTLGQENPDE